MNLIFLCFPAALWSLAGVALLRWTGIRDRVLLGTLGLATGLAGVTMLVSSASLFGLAIVDSAWFIVALVAVFVVLCAFRWRLIPVDAALLALLLPAAIAAANLLIVGQGLIRVGAAWQGLMNEDAATNALAAEFFTRFPFFAPVNASPLIAGHDYSVLSTLIYVEGGHRFADVMMLGLAAVLTQLHPDQIYMTYALMLRVALILVCATLVYSGRRSVFDMGIAIIVLSVSSLGVYTYFSQLISQMGGMTFMVLSVVLWVRLCDAERPTSEVGRTLLLLSLICAALLRAYPEVVMLLALAMLISLFIRSRSYWVARWRTVLVASLLTATCIVMVSNVSLPHSAAHILATLSIGGGSSAQFKGIMDYAFTPDALPLVFGFIHMREFVVDPWASILVVASFVFAGLSMWALWIKRTQYQSLFSLVLSLLTAFTFLWFKGEEFGTFKSLLLLQPFACLAGVLVVCSTLARHNRSVVLFICIVFGALNVRVSAALATAAVADVHPVPHMTRSTLLEALEEVSAADVPIKLDLQSYLLQQYAMLRLKVAPTFFEVDPPGPLISRFARLTAFHSALHSEWFVAYEEFKREVNATRKADIRSVIFGCGPEPVRSAAFDARPMRAKIRTVYAGGLLQPLNRAQHADHEFIFSEAHDPRNVLAQRETSLGGWEVRAGPRNGDRSLFFAERDPMEKSSTMSAVGRHVLLEVIGPDANPIRLRLRFTRSFFGPSGSKLPLVQIVGETSASLGGHGAGALDLTTTSVVPCRVQGRSYVMIDFGKDPEQFEKTAPFMYRILGIPYSPDTRRSVGFLRDVSIVSNGAMDRTPAVAWAPKTAGRVQGFVGIFEDGWLSDDSRIDLQVDSDVKRADVLVEIDPALVPAGKVAPKLSVTNGAGVLVTTKQLSVGQNRVSIPVTAGGINTVRLSSDIVLPLPGDGRLIAGRLVSIELE